MTAKDCTPCNLCRLFQSHPQSGDDDILHCTGTWKDLKGYGNANSVHGVRITSYEHLALVARCSKNKGQELGVDTHVVSEQSLKKRLGLLEYEMWKRRGYEICPQRDHHAEYDRAKFMESVVIPMLGACHVPLMVRYHESMIDAVNNFDDMNTRMQKCARLREIGAGSTLTKDVLLMPDATLLARGQATSDTVCVEIKPKFGNILTCDTVPLHERTLKHTKSRYSLHQILKLEQGSISSRSAYDPLDLFSNQKERMVRTLIALFDNPQNNLSVFCGGHRCPLDDVRGLCKSIVQTMFPSDTVTSCAEETLSIILAEILLQENVLQNILTMQNACQYDVQAVEKLVNRLVSPDVEISSKTDEPSLALERLLTFEKEKIMDIVADYCIAATAKDCSLMISFCASGDATTRHQPPNPCGTGAICTSLGISCMYRITIVDLDRKPLEKIKAHAALDKEIMRVNSAC